MNVRRYGIVEGSLVEKYGYGLPPTLGQTDQGKGGWNPSAHEDTILQGPRDGTSRPKDQHGAPLPAGGCLGETNRSLGGDPPMNPGAVSMDSFQASETDPRVVEAMKAWSECMASSGFDYASPWQPNDTAWPEPAGATEIRTAAQDIACRQESNLVGTWFAVESAYQQRVISQHRAEFAALQAWRDRRVAAARRVLDL